MSCLRLTVLNALVAALLLVSPARGATIPVYSSVTANASAEVHDFRDPFESDSDAQDSMADQTVSINPLSTSASAGVGVRGSFINVTSGVSALWTDSSQGTVEFGAGWSQHNNGFSNGDVGISAIWQYVFQNSGDTSISIDYEAVGAGFGIHTFDIIISGISPGNPLELSFVLDTFNLPGPEPFDIDGTYSYILHWDPETFDRFAITIQTSGGHVGNFGDETASLNGTFEWSIEQASAVPEPGALTLLGLGTAGLACVRLAKRRRNRNSARS